MVVLEPGNCLASKIFLSRERLSFHFMNTKIKKKVHYFVVLVLQGSPPTNIQRSWQHVPGGGIGTWILLGHPALNRTEENPHGLILT